VKAQEVGRATVSSEQMAAPIESFTIRSESSGAKGADLVLEWEKTRIRVPIAPG
jgi:predicted secreted hydrolase